MKQAKDGQRKVMKSSLGDKGSHGIVGVKERKWQEGLETKKQLFKILVSLGTTSEQTSKCVIN